MYNKKRADLLTMDMNIPSTDGIVCMKNILKINSQTKVLMVSAVDQLKLMNDAINAGARGYINKSFNKVGIISKVKELLN